MIVETTMFWNEESYFAERVANALAYADYLVISESDVAFSKKLRRDYLVPGLIAELDDEQQRRVIFDPVDLEPLEEADYWQREAFVRDSGVRRLRREGLLKGREIVLAQDFDEFLHPAFAGALRSSLGWPRWRKIVRPTYRCTYYGVDWQIVHPKDHLRWSKQVAFHSSLVRKDDFSVDALRVRKRLGKRSRDYWGWHHSYLGGIETLIEKIRSFSHADDKMVVDNASEEAIAEALRNRGDLFGRGFRFEEYASYEDDGIPALVAREDLYIGG